MEGWTAANAMIDFHNHLIPGVDDGATDADGSAAALAVFREQGVRTVVATPHVSGALTLDPAAREARLAELDAGWAQLLRAAEAQPDMQVMRGAEVMLDHPQLDLSDPRLRLAGTPFVLVEFPFMGVPPNGPRALFDLKMAGWHPVLAHPERYSNAADTFEDAGEWRRVGAHLQVNSGSLLGRYGAKAQALAWGLLERGWVDYLSSDFHARGGCPVAEARAALASRGAEEQAVLLTETNPQRLLNSQAPLSVAPVGPGRSLWRRLLGRR
jgi:protein-tyrosine phosphatase